jgi:phage major head subunit gpT-like protein
MADSSHVINQTAIDAAATVFRTMADELFTSSADEALVNAICETIPADGGTTTSIILEDFLGNWLEFSGARQTGVSRAYRLNVALTSWAVQLKVRRRDAEYDRSGIVAARVRKFMSAAQSYKDFVLHQGLFLNSGDGPVGFDGVNLISTSHPNGPSGNQSNKTTSALSPLTFDTAFSAMTSYQRENGEPFRIVPRYLVVGPKNRLVGAEITKMDIRGRSVAATGLEAAASVVASAGVSNAYNGTVDLVVNSRLVGTQDDYWYLVGEGPGGAKPMFFVEGAAPREQLDIDLSSPTVMQNDALTFGLIADGQYAAGMWPCIYGGIL